MPPRLRKVTTTRSPAWCADVWVLECIVVKLGLSPQEVEFEIREHPGREKSQGTVVLRQRHGTRLDVMVGELPGAGPECRAQYHRFLEHINRADERERLAVWHASMPIQHGVTPERIARALLEHGFDIDCSGLELDGEVEALAKQTFGLRIRNAPGGSA